jgi:hypothetical protein
MLYGGQQAVDTPARADRCAELLGCMHAGMLCIIRSWM